MGLKSWENSQAVSACVTKASRAPLDLFINSLKSLERGSKEINNREDKASFEAYFSENLRQVSQS